jgi:hypothetical protein
MINHHAIKPPAIMYATPAPTILKEIELVSGGRTYHIPVTGIACAGETVFVSRIVQQPSRRLTVVVSCDGPGVVEEVTDDPTVAPVVKRQR